MYPLLLALHSWNRWLVLVFALLTVISALTLASRKAPWTRRANKFSVFFTAAVDIQFLLGVLLYAVATPWMRLLLQNPGGVMGERVTRFWTVEHLFGMVVAVTLIHIGRVKIKKSADAVEQSKKAAIFFTIALLIMLATIPWPGLPQGRPLFRL